MLDIEKRSIAPIPPTERHGRPASLFSLWFMGNAQIVVISYGVAVVALGLSLGWALAAIVIGTLIGTPIVSYHSAQGPRLGLPQMVQSRAQFGYRGALLPVLIALALYVIFVVLGGSFVGSGISTLLGVSYDWGVIIFNIAAALVVIFGYDMIHRYNRWIAILTVPLFIALFVKLASEYGSVAHAGHGKADTVAMLILGIAISATSTITYSPYVSDYSRYLPEDTSWRSVFWYTAFGMGVGALFGQCLGALAGAVALSSATSNSMGYLSGLFGGGWTSTLLLLVIILGALPGQLESIYGGVLATLTSVSRSGPNQSVIAVRIALAFVIGAIGTIVAIVVQASVFTFLTDASIVLLLLLIPWAAINLSDYYLVRKANYDLNGFFDSSVYGEVNLGTLLVYAVGFGIEWPFVNQTFFTGPLASAMGGADISWLIGFFVTGALYATLARTTEWTRLVLGHREKTGPDSGVPAPVAVKA